ncbi:MAG: putative L-lysine-epsilon aminotransferase [Ignavibacteriaceae bacterium]|nr:putative L-lysine-epsilon aminotransferase [Ignavibacteriaceae bacterium]
MEIVHHSPFSLVKPEAVHAVLSKNMLADGFEFVLDLEKSQGSWLYDSKSGDRYLDFFSFFASNALGMNHPAITTPEFREKLILASQNKPSNSDIYSEFMAEFVQTFSSIAKPDHFKYLFFVEGGSVAVENGLKVAFDWKVKKNFKKGYKEEKGTKVLHFKEAFHGRTGYTLSLTNTDPNKVQYFPKFDWPRVTNPKITFPLENNLGHVIDLENQAISEIEAAISANKDDIALIILEPIQAEGGDNFFRKEFLIKLREIADANDILLMFDEVQTGMGMTGKMWASEHFVMPDIVSFGKKFQVCGIMVSDRIDDIEDHCFRKSSRINSTWGGNLVDMVRATKILEVVKEENLLENSRNMGSYLLDNLKNIQKEFPNLVSNVRGLGLMCAFDFPHHDLRNEFTKHLYNHKMIILGCGTQSIRFRNPLTVNTEDMNKGLQIMRDVLYLMSSKN